MRLGRKLIATVHMDEQTVHASHPAAAMHMPTLKSGPLKQVSRATGSNKMSSSFTPHRLLDMTPIGSRPAKRTVGYRISRHFTP